MSEHNIKDELKRGPLDATGKALWVQSVAKYLIGWGPNNTAESDVILHIDTSMSAIDLEAVLTELAEADLETLDANVDDLLAHYQTQGAPNAETSAVTLTAAELLAFINTGTHATGSNINYQLPTGTAMDAGADLAVDEGFEWSLLNLSAAAADTITITANTNHTVVGIMVVQSAHSTTGGLYGNAARFFTRKTAANTFVTYRIA